MDFLSCLQRYDEEHRGPDYTGPFFEDEEIVATLFEAFKDQYYENALW